MLTQYTEGRERMGRRPVEKQVGDIVIHELDAAAIAAVLLAELGWLRTRALLRELDREVAACR